MKLTRRAIITTGIVVVVVVLTTFLFMDQKVFGKEPSGEDLDKVRKSPNYKDGVFQNLSPTDVMSKDSSFFGMLKDYFNKPKETTPDKPLPSVKTNLKDLPGDKPTIVWFGHSSYFIKSKGVNILIDPVFSGNASPVSFFGKSFDGTDVYKVEDFPAIDILFISHDHYDHLDYKTIVNLNPKVKKIYTSLGVGSHLKHWGIDPKKIVEFDWWDKHQVSNDISITAAPARHFSGRSVTRAKSLWSSFILNIHGYNLFLGGDSGYDKHFKTIGEQFGPFDIAILENGQYNKSWPNIHTMPEETALAAKDLKAKMLLPVHWGKFTLAYHAWDEPIKRVVKAAAANGVSITTPMIGEPIILDQTYPNTAWWA